MFTWIDAQHVLFSHITKGIYMKVVTSAENLAPINARRVLATFRQKPAWPIVRISRQTMSGYLVVEMGNSEAGGPADWFHLMAVPLGTSGTTRCQVYPGCRSPDGTRMYFSAEAGSGFHLWREHSDGAAEQLPPTSPRRME